MLPEHLKKIKTLGDLKESGYQRQSIKDELRKNLIAALQKQQPVFPGIIGYENTVIPELQNAILARHNILLLGLRGQAKTRIARLMVELLDEWIPIVQGSEINDDPLFPISRYARERILEEQEDTPIEWIHRQERYVEKLATPDVTIADLIGDIDPIKAANLKLSFSDERVIHFGLIPRAHRCIFVINEIPDLQPRIQVALFNILQEKDIQIRGFKLRFPLDVQIIFTANPEDYTNRGSIITPLKDRIESQILTHYPKTLTIARKITEQEVRLLPEQKQKVFISALLKDLIEQVAFEARESEFIDKKSGVSARLPISALECLVANAERRILLNNETSTSARIADLYAVVPAITGKIELVYEGEQEGTLKVAYTLIGKAIRTIFLQRFPDPEKIKKAKKNSPYQNIINWFNEGNQIELLASYSETQFRSSLYKIKGLEDFISAHLPELDTPEKFIYMEFILHGLAECSLIGKKELREGFSFNDVLGSYFNLKNISLEDEDAGPHFN
ncbi:MAG: AAA family ATPase [Bacteroidia bacterium]|nr:AAA family ATPase [Bacteroidia bacterium]MDW8157383.1 AAA family ATPase [Bacteroidia bacterium]